MKIALADIVAGSMDIKANELMQFQDRGVELSANIQMTAVLTCRDDNVYSLCGDLTAQIRSCCERCGERVLFDVERTFVYHFLLEKEPQLGEEYECTGVDHENVYLSEPVIESTEQLLLTLPFCITCTDNCAGLCDQCGCDLNKEQCTCREKNENSPFAILANLQKS